jgi:hypothetical protein
MNDELTAAYDLVLANLTDLNAHTIAALLEWQYYGTGNDDTMLKAYKAAQLVLSGTQWSGHT